MSGVMAALAGGVSAPPPLNVSLLLTGSTSFNVAGASGSLAGIAAVGFSVTGGTEPVSSNVSAVKEGGAGAVGLGPYGDGQHQTPTWSGLNVGQSVAFHLEASASDSGSPQQNVSTRYPPSGQTIVITRTS